MREKFIGIMIAVLCLVFAGPITATAEDEAGEYIVSLYHAAPGKQIDLLKWFARQDEIGAEVGLPPVQIYTHMSGDSWDYLMISPVTTDAQDAAFAEAAKKRGGKGRFAGGLRLRKYLQSHNDTLAWGPSTAAELVEEAGK
ncbi:MAG: hypothetical protein IID51_09980 [Proteobacteria bacterium]|nr:hypothetical protein [Pseudomonadota bacterium]